MFLDTQNWDGSSNLAIPLARAAGQGINLGMAVLLLTMCRFGPSPTTLARPLLTLARRLGLHRLLPLDLHVTYHKATGVLVALLATVHTAAHIHNMATNLLVHPELFLRRNGIPHDPEAALSSLSLAAWLFTPLPGVFGLLPGLALPSGVLLLLAFAVLLVGALPAVRSSGYFEVSQRATRPPAGVLLDAPLLPGRPGAAGAARPLLHLLPRPPHLAPPPRQAPAPLLRPLQAHLHHHPLPHPPPLPGEPSRSLRPGDQGRPPEGVRLQGRRLHPPQHPRHQQDRVAPLHHQLGP